MRALCALQDVLAGLGRQQAALAAQAAELGVSPAAAGGVQHRGLVVRQLQWLLLAAAGYVQSLLSKADVAALLLSRKIMLADLMVRS